MIMKKIFVNSVSLVSFLESLELKDKLLIYFESFIFTPNFNGLFYYFSTYNILLFLRHLMECILCRIQHYIALSSMLDWDVIRQKSLLAYHHFKLPGHYFNYITILTLIEQLDYINVYIDLATLRLVTRIILGFKTKNFSTKWLQWWPKFS